MPSAPPSTSESTRRISALSSTTRTLGRRSEKDGIGAHRPDFHPAVRHVEPHRASRAATHGLAHDGEDRKSTRLNSSHSQISYAVFCLKKKNKIHTGSATSPHAATIPPPPSSRLSW